MANQATTVGPKVHPASREILPDDPFNLQGCEVAGDHELMLRLLVEEYARLGWGTDAILCLARDPNYLGFHGLLRLYGDAALRERIANIVSRTGVLRVTEYEALAEPAADELVEIDLTLPPSRRDCHAQGL